MYKTKSLCIPMTLKYISIPDQFKIRKKKASVSDDT
jgi:hypothetical protein